MSRELFVAEPVTAYDTLPPIVVDCSVLAAILFQEPSHDEALKLLCGKSLHAPNLIDHEIVSVAVKKAAANAATTIERGLEGFRKLRLARHHINHSAQFELALRENITAYDAAYLHLAVSLNAPLATYDRVLASAAREVLSSNE